jgi:hypothetical protein
MTENDGNLVAKISKGKNVSLVIHISFYDVVQRSFKLHFLI